MIVKLLTGHHLEFLSFKGGCTGSSVSTKSATLLEITCHGSFMNPFSRNTGSASDIMKTLSGVLSLSFTGMGECLTLALRKRCRNALERRSRRRNFARRCEINFLPVVQFHKSGHHFDFHVQNKRENHLTCRSNIAGYGRCPILRTESETAELICNPFRDNTKRCSTTHETVHTSCRMFEICDQAVLISGGWNRQTTGTRHKRNVELFYWMLRENGFKKRNIKIFFANGAEGIHSKYSRF